MKRASSVQEVISLIQDFRLSHEMVTNEWKTKPEVWDALLPHLGLEATLRNLANMTRYGLLTQTSDATNKVIEKITNEEALKKARVHPIKVLSALLTYKEGRGVRGSGVWTPVQKIVDALDEAFYKSFSSVEPTGKRRLLALDVSSSMSGGEIAGVPGLTPCVGTAALAMAIARTEKDYQIVGFCHNLINLPVSPRMRLDDAIKVVQNRNFGSTDASKPMLWAEERGLKFDSFEVFTDNETWSGGVHPSVALKSYRQKTGIPAKEIACGMTATGFTIADPNDPLCLDVVGFDTAVPELIANFIR